MSCYRIYKNQYQDALDAPKVLGTLADDYTGGTACILPYKVVNTFQDRSAPDFITATKCEFQHPTDPARSVILAPTETGCRIDFATLTRDEAKDKLDILQSLYDKNVIEKKLALQAELSRKYEELAITQSNFDEKKKKLDATIQTYYGFVADSNALIRERDQLRKTQAAEQARLKRIREDIEYAKTEADITVDNLNKTIAQGDQFLQFIAVSEHVYFDGAKVTLTPQIYEWYRMGGSSSTKRVKKGKKFMNITRGPTGPFGISSVIIPPGMQVKVWTGRNYSGDQKALEYENAQKKNFLTLTYTKKEVRYEERFSQQEEPEPDKPIVEHFLPLLALIAMKKKKPAKKGKTMVPVEYDVTRDYNDNVACIEVQKIKSVGEYMDSWNGI